MSAANGSNKVIVFGTYTAPTGSTGWGTFSSCHPLQYETACQLNRNYDSEDLKYKAGVNVPTSGQITVTDTIVKSISYEITCSCYGVAGTTATGLVNADQLRFLADHATSSDGVKTIAIFSRPSTVQSTSTTIEAQVADWGEPDLVMDAVVTSFSEPENVGESVKLDVTFKQVGALLHAKATSWPA